MNQFNLGQFLTKVIDYSLAGIRGNSTESTAKMPQPQENFSQNLIQKPPPQQQTPILVVNTLSYQAMPLQTMQMNHLENLETALYVKDLMNLPKDMKELLNFVQKNLAAAEELPNVIAQNINLNEIALLLQQSGKEAVNKLIMTMANASKQGITDLSQLKNTMKLINACVSAAREKNLNTTLKSLMLLYLPWLPLQEGVDFELEFLNPEKKSGESESSLTILISTKNYGNVKATLIMLEGNSINIIINCSNEFPKEELLKRIKAESKNHSVQSNVIIEQKQIKQSNDAVRQAKVTISNSTEINPFLLLMAHAVIRHTIEIDNIGV